MEVLPCPFCGAIPDVREAINHKGVWAVFCANFDEWKGCEITPHTKSYLPVGDLDGKSRAIAAWNQRADTSTKHEKET